MNVFFKGGRGLCYLKRLSHLFKSKNNRSRTLFSFVLSLICVLYGDAQAQSQINIGTSTTVAKLLGTGDVVPEELWNKTLLTVNSKGQIDTMTLSSMRSKDIIVLDFWATWCSPCIKSVEKWAEVQQRYPDNVALLPVHMDYDYKAYPFMKGRDWKMPNGVSEFSMVLCDYFFNPRFVGGVVWILKDGTVEIMGKGIRPKTVDELILYLKERRILQKGKGDV